MVFCRLDFWLFSQHLQDLVDKVEILDSIKSDHSAISLHVKNSEHNLKGPGFWRFNTSLLKDVNYIEELTELINSVRDEYANEMQDKIIFWEWLKFNIRSFSIQYSKKRAKKNRESEVRLEKELCRLSSELQNNPSSQNYELYKSVKSKLEQIYDYKVDGIMTRARLRWYEKGERSTKYFFSLQKRNYARKTIRKLRIHDRLISDPHKIIHEQKQFYQSLYSSRKTDLNSVEAARFLSQDNIPRLSNEMKISCEGKLTYTECQEIISTFQDNKTPGNDGLPIEFYKGFWCEIGKDLVESLKLQFRPKRIVFISE